MDGKHCKQKLHVTRVLPRPQSPNLFFPCLWFIAIHGRIIRLRATKFDETQHLPASTWREGEGPRERAKGDKGGDGKSAAFQERSSSRNEVNGIYIYIYIAYKRGSEHRGRNPNLITSGPPAVDSIFKMTGGRDGCDVTLRRRLKPY